MDSRDPRRSRSALPRSLNSSQGATKQHCDPITRSSPVPIPAARARRCGNGHIDTFATSCEQVCASGCGRSVTCGVHCDEQTETCDGAELPTSCGELGFAGGQLGCASRCGALDTRQCEPCFAGPRVTCGTLPMSGLVDVESHTYESRYLPEWPAPIPLDGVAPDLEARLRDAALPLLQDLRLAKARLEAQLPGKVVKHLAFPAYDGTAEGIEAAQQCGYEACHWGLLPGRPVNRSGASPLHVARLSHEYLRRLPGDRRDTLVNVALSRARIVRSAWGRPCT